MDAISKMAHSIKKEHIISCFAFSASAFLGIGGSITTILLALFTVYCAFLVLQPRSSYKISKYEFYFLSAVSFYVAINIVCSLMNIHQGSHLGKLAALLLFMAGWLVLPAMRFSKASHVLDQFLLGSSVCGMLALPLSLWQAFALHERAEGGAGNALPFAMISSLMCLLSLLNGLKPSLLHRILGYAGFTASFACLLLSIQRASSGRSVRNWSFFDPIL